MSNRKPGERIPAPGGGWGPGKCTWDKGPGTCNPHTVRAKIGEKA